MAGILSAIIGGIVTTFFRGAHIAINGPAAGLIAVILAGLVALEGNINYVLAAIVAAVYGIPLLTLFASKGWALPGSMDDWGIALGEKIFPAYSAGLVIGTTVLVLIITTIVSFLPTRKIAKLEPTDALRGRMS